MSSASVKGLWERILESLEAKNGPEVARKLGKTKQSVYEWRDGKNPGLETLISIAETGNVSLDWLLLDKGPKKLPPERSSSGTPLFKLTEPPESALTPELKAYIRREVIDVLGGLLLSSKDRDLADSLMNDLRRQIEKGKVK